MEKNSNVATYKLIGFMDFLKVGPDLIYPVFEGEDGQLYFANSKPNSDKKAYIIDRFDKVRQSTVDENLVRLEEVEHNEIETDEVAIGTEYIFIFWLSENSVQIGRYEQMKQFLEGYDIGIDDEYARKRNLDKEEYCKIIRKEIDEFINCFN